jgi:uncharacterized protein (TIGR02145 family)
MKYKIWVCIILSIFLAMPVSAHAQGKRCNFSPPTTMQSFTSSYCNALATGETLVLIDTRNLQSYRVRKFADGHCWMIDNMKLADVTLTPADSDVTEDVTLPAVATSGSANDTDIQIWDGTAQTYCATASNFAADSTTRCGYHYNWMGATAGTGTADIVSADATMSICPKGWKLPAGSGDGSFDNLVTVTGMTGYSIRDDITGLSARLTGGYASNWISLGSDGNFWTRTAASTATNARYLPFQSSIWLNASYPKHNAFVVRCVL